MGELDNSNKNYPHHTRQGGDLVKCFWCEENGINIKPEYHFKDGIHEWRIGITINNKTNLDPKIYEKKDIMDKIYEYSNYYYKKYSNSTIEEDEKKLRPIWGGIYDNEKEQKI